MMIDRDTVARVFAEAKDAPSSFESEDWLEGFEDGRCMIAVRLALDLPEPERAAFLTACAVGTTDEGSN